MFDAPSAIASFTRRSLVAQARRADNSALLFDPDVARKSGFTALQESLIARMATHSDDATILSSTPASLRGIGHVTGTLANRD